MSVHRIRLRHPWTTSWAKVASSSDTKHAPRRASYTRKFNTPTGLAPQPKVGLAFLLPPAAPHSIFKCAFNEVDLRLQEATCQSMPDEYALLTADDKKQLYFANLPKLDISFNTIALEIEFPDVAGEHLGAIRQAEESPPPAAMEVFEASLLIYDD